MHNENTAIGKEAIMEYTVERIEGAKRMKKARGHVTYYLVKWQGWAESTWEPEDNLSNCQDKVDEFKARRASAAKGSKAKRSGVSEKTAGDVRDKDQRAGKGASAQNKEQVGISKRAVGDVRDEGQATKDVASAGTIEQVGGGEQESVLRSDSNQGTLVEVIPDGQKEASVEAVAGRVTDRAIDHEEEHQELESTSGEKRSERERDDAGRMPLVPAVAEAGPGTASDPASVFAQFPAGNTVGVLSSVAGVGEDVSAPSECRNGNDRDRAHVVRSVAEETDQPPAPRASIRNSNVHLLENNEETKSDAPDNADFDGLERAREEGMRRLNPAARYSNAHLLESDEETRSDAAFDDTTNDQEASDVSASTESSNDNRDRAQIVRSVAEITDPTPVFRASIGARRASVRLSNVHLLESDEEAKSDAAENETTDAQEASQEPERPSTSFVALLRDAERASTESRSTRTSRSNSTSRTPVKPKPKTSQTVPRTRSKAQSKAAPRLQKKALKRRQKARPQTSPLLSRPTPSEQTDEATLPDTPVPDDRHGTNGGFLNSDGDDDDDGDDADDDEGIDTVVHVDRGSDEEDGGDGDDAEEDGEYEYVEDTADDTAFLPDPELRAIGETGWISTYYGTDRVYSYEGLDEYIDPPRLTVEAEAVAKKMNPIDIFFFMMPKKLWREIATETNRYEQQTRPNRIEQARRKYNNLPDQVAMKRYCAASRKIKSFDKVTPIEILQVMGLFIARSMCPHRMGLEQHWSTTSQGAIPAGTWSSIMPRQRFRDIFRFIHFSDNKDERAKLDRAWKIRPIVDTLQDRFAKGLDMGKWVAFDEMVIPSRSSQNAIRLYLKNKPHKYGTKLFATCCGETKYCVRIEVYCGKKQNRSHVDSYAGKRAVIRAVRALWPNKAANLAQKRVIVTDREYTSVALFERLLRMGFFAIGTALTGRLGFPQHIKFPFKEKPTKEYEDKRGMCTLVRCVEHPDLHACAWLDRKPVYFLSTGVSTRQTTVDRKLPNGRATAVSCPEFVSEYNKYMGGVDAHDQLRLQRYSVQRSVRFAKYYKMLFLGLFDMALVNSYIVHREYCRSIDEKPLSHAQFRIRLHEQLIEMTPAKFANNPPRNVSGEAVFRSPGYSATVTAHTIVQSNDKKPSGGARFRVCKVCSILHSQVQHELAPERPTAVPTTRWYCKECSSDKQRVYLCNTVQRDGVGNQLTCFQTWHQLWNNGQDRSKGTTIRMRSHQEPTPPPSPSLSPASSTEGNSYTSSNVPGASPTSV